ncbi:MAG: hypothetical protein AABZ74_06220 [Cyanobacteriota bacterium]
MNNECKYFDNIFIDYINKNTNAEDTNFCLTHIKECNNCKNNEIYRDFIFTWQKLDNWNEINVSKNFMAKLQHKIVLAEEKQILFWHRIDSIFSIFRIPITACFLLFFVSLNSLSYAGTNKLYVKKESFFLENKISEIKKIKTLNVLENIIKLKNLGGMK